MLKVEGIAFRFLPDPVQIKNALEVGACETVLGLLACPSTIYILCFSHIC